jgi:hypothetical protein
MVSSLRFRCGHRERVELRLRGLGVPCDWIFPTSAAPLPTVGLVVRIIHRHDFFLRVTRARSRTLKSIRAGRLMKIPNVDNYVVRIYRRSADMMLGVVETDIPEDCVLFHSFAELESILARDMATTASQLHRQSKLTEEHESWLRYVI